MGAATGAHQPSDISFERPAGWLDWQGHQRISGFGGRQLGRHGGLV